MLKKLLKLTLLTLLVLIVGGGATLVFLSRQPEPEAICTNLFDLTQQELRQQVANGLKTDVSEVGEMTREDAATALKMSYEECVRKTRFRLENSTRAGIVVAREARCQASAGSLQEYDDC